MASTAKYSPAPAVDPDEHLDYTSAPPSYQATAEGSAAAAGTGAASASAATDEELLFAGAPRHSQDDDFSAADLPDDFKFGGSVAEATVDIRQQFVRKVYAILTTQLLATVATCSLSFWSAGYRTWIQSHPGMVMVSLFAALGFMFLTFWKRKSYPANLLFLGGFTLLEAYSISVVVSFYDAAVVLNAVALTAGIFLFLTAFACQTRYDFTSWIPYLSGALWGLILFGFAYAFLPATSTSELVYGLIIAFVFSGYILVDTQLVLRKHHVEEEIAAAMSLYLDILNLFLAILRILNSQQNN